MAVDTPVPATEGEASAPALAWTDPDGRQERSLGPETSIGRGTDNDIQLLDLMASTAHARILREGDTWILEDNGSTNGTCVNGEPRQRSVLHDGDVIRIGDTNLTFSVAEPIPTSTIFLRPAEIPAEALAKPRSDDLLDQVFQDNAEAGQFKTSSLKVSSDTFERGAHDADALERRLETSFEIARSVAATLDLPQVMDRILGALFGIFTAAERAFILLVDPDTGEVSSAAVRRRGPHATDAISLSRTALREAMDRREAVLCLDAMTDARYADARSVVSLGIRSMMIAPLVFQDQVLGAIYLDTRHSAGQFTQPDLELLTVAAGQAAGCVANARLHSQVVQSERLAAVGQTVAGLTHCIKNILQGIQGGAFIVDKALRKGNPDQMQSGWEMVKRNNVFMEDLVFDLLSFSKPRQPEYSAVDLNQLCGEVCELAAARGETKGVAVAFHPDAKLGPVELDATGVRRCLLNLAMNAVDACEENKGSVTVTTESPRDGFARVVIRDAGCGMSEAVKARLFTAFFSTKKSKGTGLGLPVAKKIVEEHGGRIEVASREGEGTTFTVCLPPARKPMTREGVCDDGRSEKSADC